MSGAEFGSPLFNGAEFNEGPLVGSYFIVFLNPDTTMTRVAEGPGTTIPPSALYPGHQYLVMIFTNQGTVNLRFSTPPAVTYDGLGG